MKTQDVFIAHPKTSEQINALKAFMQALKIKFEVSNYKPEFVAKIKESKQQYKEGKFTRLKVDKLDAFLGLK